MPRLFGLLLTILAAGFGCSSAPERSALTLATTTSTRDSGLLDDLLPIFEEQSNIEIKVVAVGSGQALELGRRGDADVLLTHSPQAEEAFMAAGHGSQRLAVMHNDFVMVGPQSDPAGIRGQEPATALQSLVAAKALFVSRGDESGTHAKEKMLWKESGLEPAGDWYVESGSGMAATLRMADEKQAYTLADRGTFLAQRKNVQLVILVQKNPPLDNHYSVIVVHPARSPGVNHAGAKAFAQFLVAPQTQRRIAEFGTETFGEPLFYPDALSDAP